MANHAPGNGRAGAEIHLQGGRNLYSKNRSSIMGLLVSLSFAQGAKSRLPMGATEPLVTHILLVRHGQSLHNRDGAPLPPDSGLTELGWQQAHLVADWLGRNFTADALVSSSLRRALQTADVIGQQTGLPVEVMPGLDETREPYWTEFPAAPDDPFAWWDRPWQADAVSAPLYTRFRAGIRLALAELMARHLGRTVIVVSHGGTIGTILRSLFGGHQMPIFTENGAVTQLVWQEGRWRLLSHNERAHLDEGNQLAALPWSEPGPLKAIVDQFRRVASAYPLAPTASVAAQLRALVALTAPRPDDHVLDAGTGAGAAALAFAERVARVTAIDVSPAMLERAELARVQHAVSNVDIRWADATALPFSAGSFDLVVCRDLCCYIPDLPAFFDQARRVLRPTGRLALDEIVGSEEPVKRVTHEALEAQRDPALARLHSESEMEQQLRAAGFQIEHAEGYETPLDLEDWLAQAAVEGPELTRLRAMFLASIEEDAAGLRIRRSKDGEISFTLRRVRVLARPIHLAASAPNPPDETQQPSSNKQRT